MSYERMKETLAPCGLCCETCFAHVDGDIRQYSLKLKEKLGNFDAYARRFEALLDAPIFKKYRDFKEMLDFFASENCTGCRTETCKLFKNCGITRCHREKGVDFCHQCDEFPCRHTNFDDAMYDVWVRVNRKIQKDGLAAFCEKARIRPRYV